eukprot:scaffold278899_cov33-Tisochrysis_lutea.AAC.2
MNGGKNGSQVEHSIGEPPSVQRSAAQREARWQEGRIEPEGDSGLLCRLRRLVQLKEALSERLPRARREAVE